MKQNFSSAMIVYANNYQFAKNEILTHEHVQSRMLLWCKSGNGNVEIDKRRFQLSKGEFLFLPWNRKIKYIPSTKDPFLVAGIHVIPEYVKKQPIHFNVAHSKQESKVRAAYVIDKLIPELDGIPVGNFNLSKKLEYLSEYIILTFQKSSPVETEMRLLGNLILNDLIQYFSEPDKKSSLVSIELGRILQFIHDHFKQPISLIDLEEFSNLSSGGICGLFKRHLNTTPCQKIAEIKMEKAKEFLTAGRFSVAEIGQKVGIDDPYYFSKKFKKVCGVSPLEYRRQSSFL
ncbi:MAG: hypothetical protein COA79_10455 [Planctomycetota bacterium]|nr:MAG: hypothetical protein COA79_10455 [Planctomycetota bacterium]